MRLTLIAMLLASSLSAQTNIHTTPAHHASNSGFTIGPRISNYATDVRTLTPLDTGRQSSFGVVGDYRTGVFVLDFMYDHDPENGINVSDLLIDTSAYSRDRGEATVGFAVTPFLDLQGGVRFDQMRVGGVGFIGIPLASDTDIDHNALTAGLKFHTGGDPVGFFLTARGFFGSAKVDFGGVTGNNNTDTNGYRGDAGLNIRIGQSAWSVQPGFEYDHFETKNFGIRMDTNRFFLNFIFRTGS